MTDHNDPDTFVYRIRATIAQLRAETQQGVEDWTPTIARLETVLEEEIHRESLNAA